MTFETTTQDIRDLDAGVLPQGDVRIEGSGVVRSRSLTGWKTDALFFSDRLSLLNDVLPRPVRFGRPGREIPLFVDCDFSGMRCLSFNPGVARFVRCRFEDVLVGTPGSINAHFQECFFSGEWDGFFDARPLTRDPAPHVAVVRNDFRGCTGMGFQGGVGMSDNVFDAERHALIQRGGRGWQAVVRLAASDAYLTNLVTSLEGRGPFALGQDWALVEQRGWSAEFWRDLRSAVAPE